MDKIVKVDQGQSAKIGSVLKGVKIRPEFMERDFIKVETDRETKLRMYFMAVAICHQTHNLYNEKLNLWGWDYMEYGFLQMLSSASAMFNPGYICMSDQKEITYYLQKTFSPDGRSENCTLDRLPERTSMLIEICKIVKENNHSSISDLIDGCDGRLISNGKGLYEVLSQFTAFSDPEKKKITFFLKLATDAGLIRIKDPENIIPIMDYHMQRVILRMGCVEILDKKIRLELIAKKRQTSDEAIRKACIDSVRIIADVSGHGIISINDFFWSLGRSCCNVTTLCQSGSCVKQPCTFELMVELEKHKNCLFEEVCLGNKESTYRDLWEPIVDTHYY
ncbi:MAG: hypothetical protein K8R74_11745 [Bacteroidales bacterium]|nr:hypothetical protein [Bacteroidales bacterium]